MIYEVLGVAPTIASSAFIAPSASVMGDVHVGERSSVWFHATIRGDVHHIRIGADTNIQDGAVVHVTGGLVPCLIGDRVTVGHNAIIHGCTVEDEALIGMGATVLDEAVVGAQSIVGANALVTGRTIIPPRSMVLGSPAKVVRTLTDEEVAFLAVSAAHYVENAAGFMKTLKPVP